VASASPGAGTDPLLLAQALDRLMVSLAVESARDAKAIKDAYREHLEFLVLNEYSEVEGALYNGGLARLPQDPIRFNLSPRVAGAAPIGEKDLANQASYIAARPATIGALLAVASRIESGPIEITSLVRHSEYQDALRKTNTNAITSVPMHTMGLAFDIAVVNTPLSRAFEIRDVLREMRDAGDILFIGERNQLVFHVVPHPSRLGYFTDVYARALASAATNAPLDLIVPSLPVSSGLPEVITEVIDVVPVGEISDAWWTADVGYADLVVDVSPVPEAFAVLAEPFVPTGARVPISPFLLLLAGTAGVFLYRRSRDHEAFFRDLLNS
jgi:hypothetical protein